MDLRQLRYFIAIVEHGSFSRAAQHLHVTQPALSQHIRQMEAGLGVSLLHRRAQGVTPTRSGEALLQQGRPILRQFDQLMERLRSDEMEPGGAVRFGLPGTVSQLLSVPLIEAVRERHPKVRLCIAEAMSGYILDWLRDDKVDLGILYRAPATPDLRLAHILSEELCLLGPPGSRDRFPAGGVPLAEAAALDLILPGPAHGLRALLDEVALRQALSLNVEIELDAYAQIKLLVERGAGFSILPRMALAREAAEGRLAVWRVVDPPLERQVFLAAPRHRLPTRAVRAVETLCHGLLCRMVLDGTWPAALAPEAAEV